MASKNYKTGILITGNAKGGINAIRLTKGELNKFNKTQKKTSVESKETKNNIGNLITKFTVMSGVVGTVTGTLATLGAGLRTNVIRDMVTTADAVNVSIKSLSEWTYAAQKQGLAADKMGDIFKDVQDKIGDFISTGGGEAADIINNLGLSVDVLKSKSADEQLLLIAEGLDKVGTKGEKIFYLESLADEASRLLPLLENGAEGLKKAQNEARLLGVSLDSVEAAKVAQAGDEITRLTGLFTGAANELTVAFAPALSAVNQQIVDGALELGGWKGVFGNTLDFVMDGLSVLIDHSHRMRKILKLIELGWLEIGAAGLNTLAGISDITADVLNTVLIPFKKVISDISNGLSLALAPIADYLNDAGLKSLAEDLAQLSDKASNFSISAGDIESASSAMNAQLLESRAEFENLKNIEPGNELASWWDNVKKSADDAAKAQAKAKAEARKNQGSTTGSIVTKLDIDRAEKLNKELKESAKKFDSLIDKSMSFGDSINVAADSVIGSFGSVAQQIDNMIAKQYELGKLEKELAREREKQSFEYFDALVSGENDRASAAEKNLKLIEKAETNLADSRLQSNASSFAGMARTAGQFFGEQSSAREKLHKIETTFTIIETALALKKAATNALTAISNQGNGDPYTAFARIAAMAALMAGLGLFSGSVSGSAPPSAEQRQEQQGTGTILGDSAAKSASLQNTFERIEELSLDQYAELREINRSIKDLNSAIINMATRLAGRYGRFDEATYGGELGSYSNSSTGGLFEKLGNPLNGALGDPLGQLLDGIIGGFSKTKKTLEDSGIKFFSQSMRQIIESGMVDAAAYFDVKTKKSSFWGLSSSTKYDTSYEDIDANLQREFALIFTSVGDSLSSALDVLGIDAEQSLNNFVISIGNISLKDLSGDELEAELQAVFSAQADKMAQWLTSSITTVTDTIGPTRGKRRYLDDPYEVTRDVIGESWLTNFQKMGEGLADTLTRIAQEQAVFNQAIELTGQSLQGLTGLLRVEASQSIIELMGGIEKLSDASSSYFQNFFSEAEQRAQLEQQLNAHMEQLNVSMPRNREEFKSLIESLDLTTEEGKSLYAALLPLNESFAQLFDSAEQAKRKVDELTGSWQEQLDTFGLEGQELELFDLERWYQEQKAQAEEAGADISLLTELYYKRKLEIEKHYLERAQELTGGWQDALDKFGLEGRELELFDLERWYQEQKTLAEEAGADITLLTKLYNKRKLEVEQKYANEQIAILEQSKQGINDQLSNIAQAFEEVAQSIAAVSSNIVNTMLSIRRTSADWSESDYIAGQIDSAYAQIGSGSITDQIENIDSLQDLIHQRYDIERAKNDELISQIEQQKQAALSAYQEQRRAYEQMASSIRAGIEKIRESADSLLVSEKSPLKLSEQLGNTEALYERTLKDARAGDASAMSSLVQIRDKYLEQSASYYGSGSQEYKALFDELYSESKNFSARVPMSPPPHPDVSKWQDQIAEIEQRNSELQESSLSELEALQATLIELQSQASQEQQAQEEVLTAELESLNKQIEVLQTHGNALIEAQTVVISEQAEQTQELLAEANSTAILHLEKIDETQAQNNEFAMLQLQSQTVNANNIVNAVNLFKQESATANTNIINQLKQVNVRLGSLERQQVTAIKLSDEANKQRQTNNDLLNQTNRKIANNKTSGAIM